MDSKEALCEYVDCIHLPRDRGQWRALVNMAVSHHVSYGRGGGVINKLSNYWLDFLQSGLHTQMHCVNKNNMFPLCTSAANKT
jgi:hypothetical protein